MPKNTHDASGPDSGEAKYAFVMGRIFWELDNNLKIAAEHGASAHLEGQIDALQGLLSYVKGYEDTDLDSLRERFVERS